MPASPYSKEIGAIEARLGILERRNDTVEASIRVIPAIEQEMGNVCDILKRHDEALFGAGGKPGVVGRLSAVEEKVDDIKKLVLAIGTAVLASLAIGLLQLIYGG